MLAVDNTDGFCRCECHEIPLTASTKNAIIDTGTTLVGEWKSGSSLLGDEVLIFF